MADAAPVVPSNAELAREWVETVAFPSIAGQNGDDRLFSVCCALWHGFDLGAGAIDILRHYNAVKCSPPWDEGRLQYKLQQAGQAPQDHKPGGLAGWMLRKKGLRMVYRGEVDGGERVIVPEVKIEGRRPFDLAKLEREVAAVPRAVDAEWFKQRSPVRADVSSAEFLEQLYKPDERVLVFTKFASQGQFIHWCGRGTVAVAKRPGVKGVRAPALPRGGPDGVWFLSQPVSGEWKVNPRVRDERGRPKMSRRSKEVVTAWRYLVLESDEAPADLWLRFLAGLQMPIAAIYTSGGKSIHALVKVDAPSKAWWDKYRAVVIPPLSMLGADAAAITAVRLTRLPGCLRGNRRQELLYLDPGVALDDGSSILERRGI